MPRISRDHGPRAPPPHSLRLCPPSPSQGGSRSHLEAQPGVGGQHIVEELQGSRHGSHAAAARVSLCLRGDPAPIPGLPRRTAPAPALASAAQPRARKTARGQVWPKGAWGWAPWGGRGSQRHTAPTSTPAPPPAAPRASWSLLMSGGPSRCLSCLLSLSLSCAALASPSTSLNLFLRHSSLKCTYLVEPCEGGYMLVIGVTWHLQELSETGAE